MKIKTTLLAAALCVALPCAVLADDATNANNTNTTGGFSSEQVKNIQNIIHDYLVKNPQVLVEASRALQAQQMQQQQQTALSAIQKNKQDIFNNPNSPTAGNTKGNVIIVEFFDYQCGHCKAMAPIVEKLVQKNKDIKLIFKELPIFGGASNTAATAALAAAKQGKYYAFHNALFAANPPLDKNKILEVAKKSGLNVKQLQKDMDSPELATQLRDNFKLAQAIQIMGTPALIVANGNLTQFQFIPGQTNLDGLQSAIQSVSKNTQNNN